MDIVFINNNHSNLTVQHNITHSNTLPPLTDVDRCCESINDHDDLTSQVGVKPLIRRGHRDGCSDNLKCHFLRSAGSFSAYRNATERRLCGVYIKITSTLICQHYQYNLKCHARHQGIVTTVLIARALMCVGASASILSGRLVG